MRNVGKDSVVPPDFQGTVGERSVVATAPSNNSPSADRILWEQTRFPLLNTLLELSNERDDIEDRLADIKDQRRLIKRQLTKIGPPPSA